jgi:ATP-dependent DNA helicase PIF1
MLLQNLNTKRGLCNGTRLIVVRLKPKVIEVQVITGSADNEIVFIPHIILAPSNRYIPIVLRRCKYQVKLAFAMTINKSQGQTFDKVGIYLANPVSTHGLISRQAHITSFQHCHSENN